MGDVIFWTGVVLFIILIAVGIIILGLGSCTQFGNQVGLPVSFHILAGCFVNINNQWVPRDNFWQYVWYILVEK